MQAKIVGFYYQRIFICSLQDDYVICLFISQRSGYFAHHSVKVKRQKLFRDHIFISLDIDLMWNLIFKNEQNQNQKY